MKPRIVCFSVASITLLAGLAQAAEITLYRQPYFTGSQLTLRGHTPNLADVGFRDQASSVVVSSGRWEVCTQPDTVRVATSKLDALMADGHVETFKNGDMQRRNFVSSGITKRWAGPADYVRATFP